MLNPLDCRCSMIWTKIVKVSSKQLLVLRSADWFQLKPKTSIKNALKVAIIYRFDKKMTYDERFDTYLIFSLTVSLIFALGIGFPIAFICIENRASQV